MCFSPSASFVTAGITGAIGIVALSRANEPREFPFATTPLLFAVQQGIEGMLWLNLPAAPDGPISTALTFFYLFFAEAFWPVYAPIAVWLIEPNEHRRHLMVVCLGIGVGVGAYFLWWILGHPHLAKILDGHIVYVTENRHSYAIGFAYLAAGDGEIIAQIYEGRVVKRGYGSIDWGWRVAYRKRPLLNECQMRVLHR